MLPLQNSIITRALRYATCCDTSSVIDIILDRDKLPYTTISMRPPTNQWSQNYSKHKIATLGLDLILEKYPSLIDI
jgi:hypothetical protein